MKLRTLTFFEGENIEVFKKAIESANLLEGDLQPTTIRAVASEEFLENNLDFLNEKTWGFSTSFEGEIDKSKENRILNLLDFEKCFVSVEIAQDEINTNNVLKVSEIIKKISKKDDAGMTGFRFGVGIGTPPNIPFFPYAKLDNSKKTKLSVGLEMCMFLEQTIKKNKRKNLTDLRDILKEEIVFSLTNIQKDLLRFCKENDVEFEGFDLSVAPFPYPVGETSIASLVSSLGSFGRSRSEKRFSFGNPGTLFLHTFITNMLKDIAKEGNIRTCGFNGMMYSLLEDNELSKAYEEEKIGFSDLIMLSSTCGCGVDMLPLPRDTTREEIAGYICDTFSLSSILKKPLGVRLLVSPIGRPGDTTEYRHIFLSNTTFRKGKPGPHILNLPDQKKKSIFRFKETH